MSNPIKIPPSQNSKDDQKLAKNSSMCRWEMIYQKHMNVINYFQPQFSRSRARPGSWLSILSPCHCADKTMGLLFYCRGEDKRLVEKPDRSFRLIKNTFIALVIREVRWRIFFIHKRSGWAANAMFQGCPIWRIDQSSCFRHRLRRNTNNEIIGAAFRVSGFVFE